MELEERQIESRILLESSEADKATISRALKQNNDIKGQFEELKNQLVLVVSQQLILVILTVENGRKIISNGQLNEHALLIF